MVKSKEPAALADNTPLPDALAKVMGGISVAADPQGSDIPYFVSTQCALLDYITGSGGIPGARATTIFGKEGGSKSTLVCHLIAEFQRMGGIVLLTDAERRFSRDRGERIGIDLSRLNMCNSRTIEQVFKDMEEWAQRIRKADASLPVLIVIDSLAALPSQGLLDEDMTKSMPAKVARFVSQTFPRLIPWFGDNQITLVVVNQTRNHLDMSGPRGYEVRKVMGNRAMIAEEALVFWSSLMVNLVSAGLIDKEDPELGIEARATIMKNSNGPERKTCEYNVSPLWGIDNLNSKLDLLVHLGIIEQKGPWYNYDPLGKNFQRKDFGAVLDARPELEQLIREAPLLWKAVANDPSHGGVAVSD